MISRSWWTVPGEVVADDDRFVAWALRAVAFDRATARRTPNRPRGA